MRVNIRQVKDLQVDVESKWTLELFIHITHKNKEMLCTVNSQNIWLITILLFALASCGGIKNTQIKIQLEKSNCNQQASYAYTTVEMPKPFHELEIDTVLQGRLSFQSLNAANAIGILNLIDDLVILKRNHQRHPDLETRIEILELSQYISRKIDIATLEILAVSSELDCEVERAEQISAYLKGKEDNTSTKLTVGAIIVGAVAAVATGVLVAKENNSDAIEVIGISAGITEAALGILILANQRKVEFKHPRNILKEIHMESEISTIFPPSIWYYLNYDKSGSPGSSLREKLIDKWFEFAEMNKMKEKEREEIIALFTGEGGRYNANQLAKRANMYDQIDAYINLMKQDLMLLTTELEKLNNE